MLSFFQRIPTDPAGAVLRPTVREFDRVAYDAPDARTRLAKAIAHVIASLPADPNRLLLACIGSDRCTGDALGPLVGSKLLRLGVPAERVAGSLAEPLHAGNLVQFLAARDPLLPVLAIDACLGSPHHVGTIAVGYGPLHPGAAVQKRLPPVGDLYLTATVNIRGPFDQMVLQHTRLYLVDAMADVIAAALGTCLGMPLPKA